MCPAVGLMERYAAGRPLGFDARLGWVERVSHVSDPDRSRRVASAGAAGALTAACFVLATWIRQLYPFGPTSRNINDLGAQFVPMHAHLHRLLTGGTPSDWSVNWSSGLGVPFLPEYGTYLASPFAFLVALFPVTHIDLAVFVITTTKYAAAAAAMVVFLQVLGRGPRSWCIPLAVGYALSGWAMDDASYVPMWIDGLIALPVIGCALIWRTRGQHPVLAPVIVAVMWWSNFYTAWMASLGAGVIVVTLLTSDESSEHRALPALGRAFATGMLGILLAAPLLVPTFLAARAAPASPPRTFVPKPWHDLAARSLPATEGVGISPSLSITGPVLLLGLAWLFRRDVGGRRRLVWFLAAAGLVFSLQWAPTHLVWHGFDVPNGSPYRQAFVVSGFAVVMAWQHVRHGLRIPSLLGGTATLLVIAAAAVPSDLTTTLTWVLLTAGVIAVLVAAAAERLRPQTWRVPVVVVLLMVCVDATLTAVTVDEIRATRISAYPVVGPDHHQAMATTASTSSWPRSRTTVGGAGPNGPMLVGANGMDYYSSVIPADISATLRALGASWSGYRRAVYDPGDPFLDAVLGIRTRVQLGSAQTATDVTPVAPMARLVRMPVPQSPESTWERRDALADAPLHTAPDVSVQGVATSVDEETGDVMLDGPDNPLTVTLTALCPRGSEVVFHAPAVAGSAQLDDEPAVALLPLTAVGPGTVRGGPAVHLGVTTTGDVRVTLVTLPGALLPAEPLGCYDRAALETAVEEMTGATTLAIEGARVEGRFGPEHAAARVVVAVPSHRGWSCTGGTTDVAGMLATTLDGSGAFHCRFVPPGLWLGGSLGAAAGFVLLLLGRRHLMGDDVVRSPLGLEEDPADVLPDDTKEDQLDTAQQSHGREQGHVPRHVDTETQGPDQQPRDVDQRSTDDE